MENCAITNGSPHPVLRLRDFRPCTGSRVFRTQRWRKARSAQKGEVSYSRWRAARLTSTSTEAKHFLGKSLQSQNRIPSQTFSHRGDFLTGEIRKLSLSLSIPESLLEGIHQQGEGEIETEKDLRSRGSDQERTKAPAEQRSPGDLLRSVHLAVKEKSQGVTSEKCTQSLELTKQQQQAMKK